MEDYVNTPADISRDQDMKTSVKTILHTEITDIQWSLRINLQNTGVKIGLWPFLYTNNMAEQLKILR